MSFTEPIYARRIFRRLIFLLEAETWVALVFLYIHYLILPLVDLPQKVDNYIQYISSLTEAETWITQAANTSYGYEPGTRKIPCQTFISPELKLANLRNTKATWRRKQLGGL